MFKYYMMYYYNVLYYMILAYTCNLQNIIKKVAKIGIIQISMLTLAVKTTVFYYFSAAF